MGNGDIRYKVLIKSLDVEHKLSLIIKEIIRIPKHTTKTLGSKSSSFSFRNKVDLLYDLDWLSDEEYQLLLMFMEIRNQFVHNLEADSFVKVFEHLGTGKLKRFIGINSEIQDLYNKQEQLEEHNRERESILNFAFDALILKLNKIFIDQYCRLLSEKEKELTDLSILIDHYLKSEIVQLICITVDEFVKDYVREFENVCGVKTEFANKWLKNIAIQQKL